MVRLGSRGGSWEAEQLIDVAVEVIVEESGHVRRFLLVAADVRHVVEFLEAVQDNVAADEQEHIFELVYFESDAVNFGSVRSGFFMTVHSVPPATTWSTSGTAVLEANRPFVRDATRTSRRLKIVSFGPRPGDTIKSRSGGGVLVLGASIAMLIAFCQRSYCTSRRLWRNSGLRPSNHL